MTQLSKHFSLEELTRSATAIRYNIENTPDAQAIENLRHLCQQTLEPLRCRFGVLRITSGFRSDALNQKIGGHPHSQHLIGCAADIQLSTLDEGRKIMAFAQQYVPFDQCILEHNLTTTARWLHISLRPDGQEQRRETFFQRIKRP